MKNSGRILAVLLALQFTVACSKSDGDRITDERGDILGMALENWPNSGVPKLVRPKTNYGDSAEQAASGEQLNSADHSSLPRSDELGYVSVNFRSRSKRHWCADWKYGTRESNSICKSSNS